MHESEEPARDAKAHCNQCGRLGTIALVARGSPRPVVTARFCRRCWPSAHRRVLAQRDAESAAFLEAYARWAKVQQLRGDNFLTKIAFGRALSQRLGRSAYSGRMGGKVQKILAGVTWSDSASAEARIMTWQTTSFSQQDD